MRKGREEEETAREEGTGGKSFIPSSSNCVSTPDGPGTEHTSLALRKVVHLLIRLLFPPTSFWIEREKRDKERVEDDEKKGRGERGSTESRL